jgi:hypothetical protein
MMMIIIIIIITDVGLEIFPIRSLYDLWSEVLATSVSLPNIL